MLFEADQQKILEEFLELENPHLFFSQALPFLKKNKKFSYAEVARRAGYASRSHV